MASPGAANQHEILSFAFAYPFEPRRATLKTDHDIDIVYFYSTDSSAYSGR
jgi:hypothetical protein